MLIYTIDPCTGNNGYDDMDDLDGQRVSNSKPVGKSSMHIVHRLANRFCSGRVAPAP